MRRTEDSCQSSVRVCSQSKKAGVGNGYSSALKACANVESSGADASVPAVRGPAAPLSCTTETSWVLVWRT